MSAITRLKRFVGLPGALRMVGEYLSGPNDRFLVTGSNGFIGKQVVETLLEYGFSNLRCFVRPSSNLENLRKILDRHSAARNVEIISGDLLSREDCQKAAQGVSIIIHLAAGFDKSFAGAFMNSALGTRNLIEAFLELGHPKRFVNVSSFAVYSNLRMERGALLDENCALEDAPQERQDAYAYGKLKQEELVREYGRTGGLPYVIVRPGAVFGPGKSDLSGRVGINTFGFFIHLGGSNELPLTFVDNCADAIVLAALKPGVDGEVFNIVDDERLTSREFLSAVKTVRKFFSIEVIALQIWPTLVPSYGKAIPNDPMDNCRQFSIAAVLPPSGREIGFPIESFTNVWAGNPG